MEGRREREKGEENWRSNTTNIKEIKSKLRKGKEERKVKRKGCEERREGERNEGKKNI